MRSIFPTPTVQSAWDNHKQRTVFEQTSFTPGATVAHMYMAAILGGLAVNPATMLDPEAHVDHAIKLIEMVVKKTSHW